MSSSRLRVLLVGCQVKFLFNDNTLNICRVFLTIQVVSHILSLYIPVKYFYIQILPRMLRLREIDFPKTSYRPTYL